MIWSAMNVQFVRNTMNSSNLTRLQLCCNNPYEVSRFLSTLIDLLGDMEVTLTRFQTLQEQSSWYQILLPNVAAGDL